MTTSTSGGRFDKFTERAKKVLVLAQEEAQRFNHNYIGTEHLLLGVMAEGQGVGARMLTGVGVDLPRLREHLTIIIGRGDQPVIGDISLTPRAKKVIDLAMETISRESRITMDIALNVPASRILHARGAF